MNSVSKKTVLRVIEGVLLTAGFFYSLIHFIQFMSSSMTAEAADSDAPLAAIVFCMIPLLAYASIAYYNFYAYKIPHGNALRYTFFAFATCIAFTTSAEILPVGKFILPFAAIVIAYLSGRLHKITKNITVIVFVTILLVAYTILSCIFETAFQIPNAVTILLQWGLLLNSYFARFKEHKEAGLEE